MAASMISLKSVGKRFGSFTAIDSATFDIAQGEFFSLLGPSGCGKTTLLRMIGGFERQTEGDILIAGEPMGIRPPNQRPTNTVFQSYAIFPHLNIAENIAYGLVNRGLDKESISREVWARLTRSSARKCKLSCGSYRNRSASLLSSSRMTKKKHCLSPTLSPHGTRQGIADRHGNSPLRTTQLPRSCWFHRQYEFLRGPRRERFR